MDLIQLFKSVTKGLSSFLLFILLPVVWVCPLAGISHGGKMNATIPSIIPYILPSRKRGRVSLFTRTALKILLYHISANWVTSYPKIETVGIILP